MTLNLRQVEQQSIQDLPQVNKQNGGVESSFWGFSTERGSILPAWGTRERERWLRGYDRNEYNTLWQGASAGLIKKIKATPYELKGGRNTTNHFDGVLRNAQFGQGWGTFLSLMLRDYLRFDGGAYAEIIAPGNPLKAPTGAVTGIAHLDSYYCVPTGDPEFPVVYTDRKGKLHVMHYTRILRLVDMPDGDQNHPGYGLCAQSRAIAVIQRQLLMGRYIVENLDDKPSAGMVIANNIGKEERDRIFAVFRQEQSMDTPPEWGRVAWVFNMNPANPASIDNVSFSRPPEKFDYAVYVNLDVNELALAIGVDKQELWELSGATGTAGQSIIQAEKSDGKAPGEIRASVEREINNKLLPESLEFQWKTRDGRAAQQEATTAQIWVGVSTSAAPIIGRDNAAQLMANNIEGLADVLLDENGQMIRLPDADRRDPNQQPEQISATDDAPNNATGGTPQTTAQDSTPNASATPAKKDFDSTRASFVSRLSDLLSASSADEISRRRAGVVFRAQISSMGRAAYADGLKAGGVNDAPTTDDLNAIMVLTAQQSGYVTDFLNSAYANGLTESAIASHTEMWANKSLQAFFDAGRLSADANGMYQWVLGATEHCASCLAMSGQTHRLQEYAAKGVMPRSDKLECGGFNCRCQLIKTAATSQGYWF